MQHSLVNKRDKGDADKQGDSTTFESRICCSVCLHFEKRDAPDARDQAWAPHNFGPRGDAPGPDLPLRHGDQAVVLREADVGEETPPRARLRLPLRGRPRGRGPRGEARPPPPLRLCPGQPRPRVVPRLQGGLLQLDRPAHETECKRKYCVQWVQNTIFFARA